MEDRFRIQVVGQEFGKDDANLLASEASLADDRVLAELLRLLPLGTSPSPARGIIPSSHQQQGSPPATTVSSVVVPSGSADARTIVNPFRAVIGPISTVLGKDAYRDLRSAISVGQSADMRQYIQHPAQATNPRWDLIYAAVDVEINGPFVGRYVKTDSTPATSQSVSTTSITRVTIAFTQGTAAATPTRPTLPADSGSTYYIPLAYVLIPAGHTLTTAIVRTNIQECAPVLSLSKATGVATMAPATGMSSAGGIAIGNEGWTPATGRPKAFLPSTMVGSETLIVALKEISAPRTITLGNIDVIDNSRDWRRRLFRITAFADTGLFAWNSTGTMPAPGTSDSVYVSNSFDPTSYTGNSLIFSYSSTTHAVVAAGAFVSFYVDQTNGYLMCSVGATAPGCNFLLWIEASGQFNDAF